MEQIYYTQCPVGYGLGASNGFQVKRLSRGYPMTGDFRYLGLRAFPGGSRALAPPTLRYRRDGEIAEIASLTPRPNEYETERGLWGRPGGHFAHGLRLDSAELKELKSWPAGLFESPLWKRTDREPTRGRPPEELELNTPGWFRKPEFAEVAPIAQSIDPQLLAGLLTALARVTREGRTLFLVDEPARLGPLVVLLTFAFPEKFREDLTFSTYHDRPEELPGFRISGTIPLARPNKPALTAQGIVADLTLGTFEPRVEPATWARTLANWLTKHDAVDEADWSATDGRARIARFPTAPETAWSDEWLDALFGYPEAFRSKAIPQDSRAWSELANFTRWLAQTGLGEEWVRPRNPSWWLAACPSGRDQAEGRGCLVAHLALRDAWRGESQPSSWGEVVAHWFREVEPLERDASIEVILQSIPKARKPAFARALLKGLTPEGAEAVLRKLRDDPSADRAMLLPLEASAAVVAILDGADPSGLRAIVEDAANLPGATSAVLDAVEAGVGDSIENLSKLAVIVAPAFDLEQPGEGLNWAFRRGWQAVSWLEPALRPVLADPGRQDLWRSLIQWTPEDARPTLARTVLAIASDPGLPDEAFRWGIESLLLPLAPRPSSPTWAETYLLRIPSDLDLLRRLVGRDSKKLGVQDWLKQARSRGEISERQTARIDSCLDYARALHSKDAQSVVKVQIPHVTLEERGLVLSQMLEYVGGSRLEGLPFVLDATRQAWPGAFDAGAPGLASLALPLARCLATLNLPAPAWFAKLTQILERLQLIDETHHGFEPDSLAAEVVAAAPRVAGATVDPWPLRKFLFGRNDLWKLLLADLRFELEARSIIEAPEVLLLWDKNLPMNPSAAGRIYELLLNACEGERLAYSIAALLSRLKTHPAQPWWNHGEFESASNDMREGFVRLVPMAPLPIGNSQKALIPASLHKERDCVSQLDGWIRGESKSFDPSVPISIEDEPPPWELSLFGKSRWLCLRALTDFSNGSAENRWSLIFDWEKKVPIRSLPLEERYQFLAWLILGLESAESDQLSRLAKWLHRSGIQDYKRLTQWSEEIEHLVEIPGDLRLFRSKMVSDLRSELIREIQESRGPKKNNSA
jgi:hypothetical protein